VAALADLYRQSWRLVLLNAGVSTALLPPVILGLWVPLLLVVAVVVAGPLLMALMHCAVTLARTEDLRLACFGEGLRLHWRRGLALGLVAAFVAAAGLVAIVSYGRAGAWVLSAVALYLLVLFAAFQLALWPLAAADRNRPLREVLSTAARTALRRPLQALLLAVALVLVNLLGAAAALMPLLTLTVAYSSLAAAHFALPDSHRRERAG
jgi:hypothetical protein